MNFKSGINSQNIIKTGVVIVLIMATFMLLTAVIQNLIKDDTVDEVPSFDLDDFTIEEITDEQIIHIGDYCTGFMVSERCTGSKTGSADLRYDRDKYEYSSKIVNGIKNVSYSEISNATLELLISSVLNEGEAKIAVIMDNQILEYVELGTEKQLTYEVDGKHEFYVKLICKDANVEITVARTIVEE